MTCSSILFIKEIIYFYLMTHKIRIGSILMLTTIITLFSFFIFLQSFEKGQGWRIIFSSVGFMGFLFFTITIAKKFFQVLRIGKQ